MSNSSSTHKFFDVTFFILFTAVLLGCAGNNPSSNGASPVKTCASYAASGPTWIQQFGALDLLLISPNTVPFTLQAITSLATDPSGNIIGAGYALGSFPGFQNANHTAQAYIVKYRNDGMRLWLRQFGSGNGEFLHGVTTDSSGNFYAVGTTLGALPTYSNPMSTCSAVCCSPLAI